MHRYLLCWVILNSHECTLKYIVRAPTYETLYKQTIPQVQRRKPYAHAPTMVSYSGFIQTYSEIHSSGANLWNIIHTNLRKYRETEMRTMGTSSYHSELFWTHIHICSLERLANIFLLRFRRQLEQFCKYKEKNQVHMHLPWWDLFSRLCGTFRRTGRTAVVTNIHRILDSLAIRDLGANSRHICKHQKNVPLN